MIFDVLIVGQGVAGSFLGWELLKANQRIVIVDQHHDKSSSIISAGIINPLTGQRLVIMPRYDEFYDHAVTVYTALSKQFNQPFFHSKDIVRVFRHPQDEERCRQLADNPVTAKYFKSFEKPGAHGHVVHDPFGSSVIAQGGHCRADHLLRTLRQYFQQRQVVINQRFFYDELVIKDECVRWHEMEFKKVVFCEGYQSFSNPWFNDLPYNHVKGEILKVKIDKGMPDKIVCQSKWAVPLGDNIWSVGSNYNRADIDCSPSDVGANDITEGLKEFISADIQVLDHYAAVRPVVLDQTPLVGFHPQFSRIGILNGFGSKGFLIAPHFAKLLVDHLLCSKEILYNVNVSRFTLKESGR